MRIFFVLILLAFALGGCGTKIVKNDFSFSPGDNMAIAVFSVTHDKKPGTRNAVAHFYVVDKSNGNYQVLESQSDAVIWKFGDSEFPDQYGRLMSILLPASSYVLSSWLIDNGTGMQITPRTKPEKLPFELHAGEVKYMGNLHANLDTGENFLGISITSSGHPEIKNEAERDIPLFEKKYPQFKGKVVVDLLKLGLWTPASEVGSHINLNMIPVQK
ncbi:MAG: hypothetical protein PHI11_10875 [Gallionella sp.]|nr:hypothetical protein [Gallionella sp.]